MALRMRPRQLASLASERSMFTMSSFSLRLTFLGKGHGKGEIMEALVSMYVIKDSWLRDNNQIPFLQGSTDHYSRRSRRNERKRHQSRRSSLET